MKDFKKIPLFSEYRLLYTSTDDFPNTLRIMVQLKDKINLSSLSFAINQVKLRYPYFCVELKKDENGFYFIKNNRDIILEHISKDIKFNRIKFSFYLVPI